MKKNLILFRRKRSLTLIKTLVQCRNARYSVCNIEDNIDNMLLNAMQSTFHVSHSVQYFILISIKYKRSTKYFNKCVKDTFLHRLQKSWFP